MKDEASLLRSNGTFIEKAVESDGSGGRAEGPYCVYALELHCSGCYVIRLSRRSSQSCWSNPSANSLKPLVRSASSKGSWRITALTGNGHLFPRERHGRHCPLEAPTRLLELRRAEMAPGDLTCAEGPQRRDRVT